MGEGTARNAIMLKIDETRCRVCGQCLARSVCRGSAIRVIDPGEAPFIDMSRCWGCLVCMQACPFEAVVRHTVTS